MRPLYLTARAGIRVGLDGPALRISAPDRAEQLFPLRRLSRVLSRVDTNWSTEALIACAERGVPVAFVGSDGRVRAFVFGRPGSSDTFTGRLLDFLDRPDAVERYQDWAHAMERRGRLRLARRLGLDPLRSDLRKLDQVLAEAKARVARKSVVSYLERRLAAMLSTLVSEVLTESGVGADLLAGSLSRLTLVQSFTAALEWDLQLPMLRTLSRIDPGRKSRPINDADIARLFERRAPAIATRARELASNLHRWLVELDA